MSSSENQRNNPAGDRLAAIVLAAGASSRMGTLKPLLPLGGVPALARSIGLLREAGIRDVLVVLGHHAEELRPLAAAAGARCVENPRHREGMFSSVAAGVAALPPPARGIFILPADIPLVRPATIRQLAAAFESRCRGVLYPTFEGRRGHPPLIARALLDGAVRGRRGTLRDLLARHEADATDIAVPDEAIHLDMDTAADFDRLNALAGRRDIPSAAECAAMLALQGVTEERIRHSRKVADVAGRIGCALNSTGVCVDPELIQAGALLHDIAKGQPKHAEAGAEILQMSGMARVASVVAAHMEMDFRGALNEAAVVYLADKLVSGDQLVTVEERFAKALRRFRDDPAARMGAERRKAVAEKIAAVIEARLGRQLDAVVRGTEPGSDSCARKKSAHAGGNHE